MRLSLGSWRNCHYRTSYLIHCKQNPTSGNYPLRHTIIASSHRLLSCPPSKENILSGKWYPKCIADLDYNCNNVIRCNESNLAMSNLNHPSITDKEYRKRREWFWDIANNYKHGTPIPYINYTTTETNTWRKVYCDLKALHQQWACKEFLDNFKLLEKHCGYSENRIPQLEDISNYLKTKTSFTLRPCGGYLTPRDFLAALAFRVLCCSQYMRHDSNPHYSLEPDLCHEVIGHMAMFLNPEFAQFNQELGLASLGCSDEDCIILTRLYFFMVEFGLSTEGEEFDEKKRNLKIYGAGLLACFDELKFCVTANAKVYPFNLDHMISMEPEYTEFQKGYFFAKNFWEALHKIRDYISKRRSVALRYDSVTQSIVNPTDPV